MQGECDMYRLTLDVRGNKIKRFVARLRGPRMQYFSIEIQNVSKGKDIYKPITEFFGKFRMEVIKVQVPQSWTFHDLQSSSVHFSQDIFNELANWLVKLKIIPALTPVRIEFAIDDICHSKTIMNAGSEL